jgi:hypothetical protein
LPGFFVFGAVLLGEIAGGPIHARPCFYCRMQREGLWNAMRDGIDVTYQSHSLLK